MVGGRPARRALVDARLGAVAQLDADGARRWAADPRGGFFAGVPTFVKDNVDVAGMPTMQGGDAWEPRPRQADGEFARMYLATGLLPLGKSQLSEFGFSASAEHPRLGPVRSPWDLDLTAGASSAGSAALVAAGAVPIAHANDGGGSIRIPASVNGLVGLKPSRGRLAQQAVTRQMPVRLVPTVSSPAASGTPPRSTGRPSGSTAACGCHRSATSAAPAAPGSGSRWPPSPSAPAPHPRSPT